MTKVYVVTFQRIEGSRPAKFIVLANSQRGVIDVAWEHGEADLHANYDKRSAQVQEMKRGAMRVL